MLDLDALGGILGIWLTILHSADRKEVEMVVLPPHRKLQKPVQTCQGDLARYANAPPDRWLDLLKLNVKLVDTPPAVNSHFSCPPFTVSLVRGEYTSSLSARLEAFAGV